MHAAASEQRVECPLCGPCAAVPWTRDRGFSVVRCESCRLLITWPRPDAETLTALYSGDYYESRDMGREAAEATTERARDILARLPEPAESVLDFGAGQGHLVHAFQALGVRADGVESSATGRAAAMTIHGVHLQESLPDPPGAYDLITLIHSLEHVDQPLSVLGALRAHLEPGGALFIEVPHALSVERVRPRLRSEILDLPAHLHHFTPETLAPLLRRAGFAIVDVALANPDALEWALALRARWRGGNRGPDQVLAAPVSAPGARTAPVRPAGRWARSVLPWIRRRLPGKKFQMVARL